MRRLWVILFCLILPLSLLMAEDLPRVAVLDMEAKGDITQEEAEAVSDFLRTDLVETEKFTVIERSRIQDILKEQQLSLTGITDPAKATKIGKVLNCRYVVVGTLSKLGAKYFLNVRVVNVETAKTTIGKRESTPTLEELSEVSRSVAAQLAGIKYVPKKGTAVSGEEEEFENPPFGIDFSYGFGTGFNYYGKTSIKGDHFAYSIFIFADNGSYEDTTTSSAGFSDLRIGVYFSVLYLGLMSKSITLQKGDEYEIDFTASDSTLPDGLEGSGTGTWSEEGKISSQDLMIGLRGYKSGTIGSRVFYFTWHSVEMKSGSSTPQEFSGPGLGFLSKLPIDIKNTPLDVLFNIGFHGAYLSYKEPAGFKGDKKAYSFGGEIGLGLQLKKIGIYFLVDYIAEGLITQYSDSDPAVLYKADQTDTMIGHGVEIRLGYNFDLQALLH
ncbi:MAG: hypothetical protein JW827_11160 [Spirochaetes bacterium]|nr:hypothetical protein [Spirochaetota bacterium]